ncbi:Fic family protein [Caulobacter segnis]
MAGPSAASATSSTATFSSDCTNACSARCGIGRGAFSREANRRVGVDHWLIEPELRHLLDNVRFWVENNTFSPDEIVMRFHHRLTQIHAFPNGNGRHARMAADLLAVQLGLERFTWGEGKPRRGGQDAPGLCRCAPCRRRARHRAVAGVCEELTQTSTRAM